MPGRTDSLLARLQSFLRAHAVEGRLLVAVSGGPDSVCLLQALHELATGPILAAHLNHGLRGAESSADAAFVEQFCRERGIPSVIETAADLSPGQSHLEAAARRRRYDWLDAVARRKGCPWVLTGHTADDQAETVLHHLLRGTGWRGLRGIAPVRRLSRDVCLARPLLTTSRAEVLAFLADRGIAARHDRSNDDPAFTRNRLRRDVLPLLRQTVNPHVTRHLTQLGDQARTIYHLIHRRARRLLRHARLPDVGQVVVLYQRCLILSDDDILQDALRQLWRQQGWPLTAMTAARWREAQEVCRGERTAVQLPAGVRMRQKLHVVHVFRDGGG